MKLLLTDAQREWQMKIRKMATEFIPPIAVDIDQTGRFPHEYMQRFGEMGLLGMSVSKKYGGMEKDLVSYVITIEEVSKFCAVSGSVIQTHNALGVWPIERFGNEGQKRKYIPKLASGKWLGAFCLTEANAGSDASDIQTTAKDLGDHWLLNGTKMFITGGGVAQVYVIMAMTDKSKGNRGMSAFIVEKDMQGVSFGKKEDKMGIRGSTTREVILDNVKLPKGNLLGEVGKGFKIAMSGLDFGRIGVAAQSIGIAQGAFNETVKYLKGHGYKANLPSYQGIAFEMSSMKTRIEAARLLLYKAAYLREVQGPNFSIAAAEAKLFCSETAMDITTKAVQFHGLEGYTTKYTVERMMRDAKITEIYEGTSEIQKLVIANDVFKPSECDDVFM